MSYNKPQTNTFSNKPTCIPCTCISFEPIVKKHIFLPCRWHRLGFSVKGDAVTLTLDCKKQITRELIRQTTSKISTTGIVLIGQQLLDDILYTVSNCTLPAVLFRWQFSSEFVTYELINTLMIQWSGIFVGNTSATHFSFYVKIHHWII